MFFEHLLSFFYYKPLTPSQNLTQISHKTQPYYNATGNPTMPRYAADVAYDTVNIVQNVFESIDKYDSMQPQKLKVPSRHRRHVVKKQLSVERTEMSAEETSQAILKSKDEEKEEALNGTKVLNFGRVRHRDARKPRELSKDIHASSGLRLEDKAMRVKRITRLLEDINSSRLHLSNLSTPRIGADHEQEDDYTDPMDDPKTRELIESISALGEVGKLSIETANFIADCVEDMIWLSANNEDQIEADECMPKISMCSIKFDYFVPATRDDTAFLLSKSIYHITKGNIYPGFVYIKGSRASNFALCKLDEANTLDWEIITKVIDNRGDLKGNVVFKGILHDIKAFEDTDLLNINLMLTYKSTNAGFDWETGYDARMGDLYARIIPNHGILIRHIDGIPESKAAENKQKNAYKNTTGINNTSRANRRATFSDSSIGVVTLVIIMMKKLIE